MAPPPWLRILLFQSLRDVWVARALEHDIAADARTPQAAVSAVLQIVFAHVDLDRRHGRPPLSAFPPAPERYRAAFSRATPVRMMSTATPESGGGDAAHIAIAIALEHASVVRGPVPRLDSSAETFVLASRL